MRIFIIILIIFKSIALYNQQIHAPIPISLENILSNKKPLLNILSDLSWNNPNYLSDDQYSAGVLNSFYNDYIIENKLDIIILLKCKFYIVEPFINKYLNSEFVSNFKNLYLWLIKNNYRINNNNENLENIIEIRKFVNNLKSQTNDVLQLLDTWINSQSFFVLPDGSPLPNTQSFHIKFFNKLFNTYEEINVINDEVVSKRYIEQYPNLLTRTWKFVDEKNNSYISDIFDGTVKVDSVIKFRDLDQNISYFSNLNNRHSYINNEATCWHPNGKLSYKCNGLIDDTTFDTTSIKVAYSPDGNVSYINGNGKIYVYLDYSEYRYLTLVQLEIENGFCKKTKYFNNSGILQREIIRNPLNQNIEKYYNFKTGKLTKIIDQNGIKTFPENYILKQNLHIDIDFNLTHNLTSYPIASKNYIPPKLLNSEIIKNEILTNIDHYIDFQDSELINTNYIIIFIPNNGDDFPIENNLKPLINLVKIKNASLNNIPLTCTYCLKIRVRMK